MIGNTNLLHIISNGNAKNNDLNSIGTLLRFYNRQKVIKYYFTAHNRNCEYCRNKLYDFLDELGNTENIADNSEKIRKIASNIVIYAYAYASLSPGGYIDEDIFSILENKLEQLDVEDSEMSEQKLFKNSNDFKDSDIALGETRDIRENLDKTNLSLVKYIEHSNNKENQKSLCNKLSKLVSACEKMMDILQGKIEN